MPIKNYGVWKATPTSFRAEREADDRVSPHAYLGFEDGLSSLPLESAINVKSKSDDTRLVYWLAQNLDHPLVDKLKALPFGWHDIGLRGRGPRKELALDYLRSGIVQIDKGRVLPHDVPGAQNDIVDVLEPFFANAVNKATVHLFGEQYREEDGVHDVHMNQGSSGGFRGQNGIFQDGGILLEFPDGHWEGLFIAFASQAVKTDDEGHPDGQVFGDYLEAPGEAPRPDLPDGEGGHQGFDVSIEAALVNPEGPDGGDNAEVVVLVNSAPSPALLDGWTISNRQGASVALPAGSKLAGGGARKHVEAAGVPLSNRGGTIILRDASGRTVDEVRYTQEQASRSGRLIYFK